MESKNLTINDLWKHNRKSSYNRGNYGIDISSITPTSVEISEDSFFWYELLMFEQHALNIHNQSL